MSDATSHAPGWRPATFYPDPAIHALDPRFEKYWLKLSAVERLATGLRWAEGPAWFGDGRYLLCSDIPNQRIIKWEEESGAVSAFRTPSNFANGNTRDRQGRLVTCEHGGRRLAGSARCAASRDLRLRRLGGRHRGSGQARLHGGRSGRGGRHARRHRRLPLVRLGHGRSRA